MWPVTYFTEYILKNFACWVILNALLLVLEKLFNFFFKNTLFVFRSGPIQHFVGPDLGPNCLLRLWVGDIFLQSAPHFEQCSNIILNLIALIKLYLVKQYHIKGYRQADIFGHTWATKAISFCWNWANSADTDATSDLGLHCLQIQNEHHAST